MSVSRRPARPAEDAEAQDGEAITSRRPARPADEGGDEDVEVPQFRGGWTAGKQQAEATSDFAQAFKPEASVQIIKFLQDAPYVNFRRHWIERNSQQGGTVNRPYVCPQTVGKPCPICALGDKPQAVSSFNVALIGDDGVATLKTWDLGVKLFNVLANFHDDPKIGPLTRGFFAVSRSSSGSGNKKGGTTQTNVIPVKPSSLQEDYNVIPPSQAELDAVGVYDASVVKLPKRGELEEIAEELASYDD